MSREAVHKQGDKLNTQAIHFQTLLQQKIDELRERVERGGERTGKQIPQTPEAKLEDARRQRRRLNKKKRRKRKQTLKQGINELRTVVDKIYYSESSFEELSESVTIAIQKIPEENEFIGQLNQLIKEYVEDTSDYLSSEFVKIVRTIEEQKDNRKPIPKLEPEDPARFHNEFIPLIYREFKTFQKASIEIDKLINRYHKFYGYDVQTENAEASQAARSLFLSTFNHLLNIDQNLRSLLYEAEKYFNLYSPKYNQPNEQLKEMLDVIQQQQPLDQEDREHEHSTQDGSEFANLTGGSLKKKKKDLADSNEEVLDRYIVKTLEALQLEPASRKIQCQFDRSWLEKLKKQLQIEQ